jgi:prepilin-type N-terminal cleavage/methylation domain-containing protein
MKGPRGKTGLTLIELVIALALSSLLIAALYKVVVLEQRTYVVQEQVADVQQNAKAVIYRMIREIRMAGFGRVAGEYVPGKGYVSRILPIEFRGSNGETILYRNVLNRDRPATGWLTIITGINSIQQSATIIGASSRFEITVDKVQYDRDRTLFDLGNRRYISIDGVESNGITQITEETVGASIRYHLTLQHPLQYDYPAGTRVYPITAISFQVAGREELGSVRQPIAENIESLTFEYLNAHGESTPNDDEVRIVRVSVTGRTTLPDPALKGGDGYRRRRVASSIHVRNVASVP